MIPFFLNCSMIWMFGEILDTTRKEKNQGIDQYHTRYRCFMHFIGYTAGCGLQEIKSGRVSTASCAISNQRIVSLQVPGDQKPINSGDSMIFIARNVACQTGQIFYPLSNPRFEEYIHREN